MKGFILIVFIALLFAINTKAESNLTGQVVDANTLSPVIGATVQYAQSKGTITDKNGRFTVPCSGELTLTVTTVGYKTYTRTINNCNGVVTINLVPSSVQLNSIEVVDSYVSDKALLVQPSSIVKLQPAELDRSTGLYLDDAINTNVPGVLMERRTNSAGQQFNIRGYGNGARGTNGINSNFDGQGYKVYLNGIPITDAEGVSFMDDIDFNSIGSVDVLKGPSGTLYGLAIAGVVNLQTKRAPKNETSVSQDVMGGSYGLLRTTTRIEVGGESSSIMLNYGRQYFGGYMVHTAAHKDFVNFMGDFDLNAKQKLSVFMGYSNSYDERNGELTVKQYTEKDYSGNPSYIKNNAHSGVTTFRAGASHTYRFNNEFTNVTTLFASSQSMNNSSAAGWTDKSPLNYGLRSTLNMNFKLSDDMALSSITGVEMQKMTALTNGFRMATDNTDSTGYNAITDVRSIQATTSAVSSIFTQWTLTLPYDIDVTAGVGYNVMNVTLSDRLWASSNNKPGNTTPKGYEATYDEMISPSFSINKRINDDMSVYAAYSTGYKAPVSSYFFIPTTGEVNTSLKPEKGTQIEIGTKGSVMEDKLFYTLAVFNAKFTDKMTAVAVPNPANTATLYTYLVNGGTLNNKGVELLVKYKAIESTDGFVKLLSPFFNFTYSDFKYEDFTFQKIGKDQNQKDSVVIVDYSGNDVAGVPPITFNIGVDFESNMGLYCNVNYSYRDAIYFTSDGLNQTEAFGLLNGKLGYKTTIADLLDVDAYFGANNITGQQYYYMVFLNQIPDAYLPAPYEINYFGGINLKYRF